MENNLETRKIQQVGFSTLVVSLPREWAKDAGLKKGNTITFSKEEDGSLKLIPSRDYEKKEVERCIINADLAKDNRLLNRVITACYILGRDMIDIEAKELRQDCLEEIRRTLRRLTGLGVVEQTMKSMSLHNFVDPTKYSIYGMMKRHHVILSSMLEASDKALIKRDMELAEEVLRMEDESDQLYWLIVRQLILSINDKEIAKKIGIVNSVHLVGNRVVAKSLEEMADCAENIAKEIIILLENEIQIPEEISKKITLMFEAISKVSEKSMTALFNLNIKNANSVIEEIVHLKAEGRNLNELIIKKAGSKVRSAVSLNSILWNLEQIANYCISISEVTINRTIETSSDICKTIKQPIK
jgi:phosphate uptake regulator